MTQEHDTSAPVASASHHLRIRIVQWGFLVAFLVLGGRLVQLQVDPNLQLTKQDLMRIGSREIPVSRGDVLDRYGRLLATERKAVSLAVNPSNVSDPGTISRKLAEALDLDVAFVHDRATQRDRDGKAMKFVWLKRWLDDEEAEAIQPMLDSALGDALIVQHEPLRFYPEGSLAAHVVGFANKEGVGGAGLELVYEKYLHGIAGKRVSRVDARRNFLAPLTLEYEPPRGGAHVETTIDTAVQYELEQRLDQAMRECKAPRAMGLVMNPNTGAVLAMAVRPAFDPNEYEEHTKDQWRNRAVTDVFEPGSAFKVVTAAGVLETGLLSMDDEIDCENGSFNPYGHRIRDTHPLGVVPFWYAFVNSSNVALVKAAARLGPDRLEEWIARFGFGAPTSKDFPGESWGLVHPLDDWSRLTMGSLPIGQEIAVTMPQLARAFSAIANGGSLVEPYLVSRVVSREGRVVYQHEPTPKERIFSEHTAKGLRQLCDLVVNHDEGTGRRAAIAEYRAGGKTGTGQIAKPDGTGYYRDKYTAVFAGFAPVSDPEICAVIVVSEPAIRNHYGGYVSGPVFKDVVRQALIQVNAPEEPVVRVAENLAEPTADFPNKSYGAAGDADTVVARLDMTFLEPDLEDLSEPLDSLELVSGSEALADKGVSLPDFMGMTKRQARDAVAELGINWDPQGSGWVVEQEPAPGTPLGSVDLCRLVFSSGDNWKNDDS